MDVDGRLSDRTGNETHLDFFRKQRSLDLPLRCWVALLVLDSRSLLLHGLIHDVHTVINDLGPSSPVFYARTNRKGNANGRRWK